MRNMKLTICPLSTAISGYFFEKEMFDTLIDRAQSEKRYKVVIFLKNMLSKLKNIHTKAWPTTAKYL